MRIRIPEQPGTWRPDGARLFHFGEYRVPEDMSEELAKRALEEGAASVVGDAPDATVAPTPTPTPAPTAKPKPAKT